MTNFPVDLCDKALQIRNSFMRTIPFPVNKQIGLPRQIAQWQLKQSAGNVIKLGAEMNPVETVITAAQYGLNLFQL